MNFTLLSTRCDKLRAFVTDGDKEEKEMDPTQFALTIIIATNLFFAFSLALTAPNTSNRATQSNIVRLFSSLAKLLATLLGR